MAGGRIGRWVAWAVVVSLGAAAVTHGRLWRVPDRHNPWAPLGVDDTPGWLTRHKLRALGADPAACHAWLAEAGWRFRPVPDRHGSDGCGLTHAVQVQRTQVAVGPAFTLSCPAALSLAVWERHVLLPEAERTLGARVARLDHFGSYACRNVYGRAEGRRSQHATADAFDLAGVVLADGRRISVARHWGASSGDPAAAFLHAVHAGACGVFDGVLGPAYNRAHADHLHLDRGPYRVCR